MNTFHNLGYQEDIRKMSLIHSWLCIVLYCIVLSSGIILYSLPLLFQSSIFNVFAVMQELDFEK